MTTFLRVAWARLRDHFRREGLDREFDQELATHLAMAEEDKRRQGMTRRQARRAARIELGGLTQLREVSREARGLPWLDSLRLDAKLGLRMLRKSWGLTLVGGLAMTVVIGFGAVIFAVFDLVFNGTVPLEDGDRVVVIQTWDEKAHLRRETSIADFDRWRETLRSVEDIGAFQTVERKLVVEKDPHEKDQGVMAGPAEPVAVAEMTASGFRLARVSPLLGRPLVEDDEHAAASPVVVIGYDIWQSRFSADPAVLGRTVRLGGRLSDTVHTVVGVMPEGFEFPVNHRFWIPLQEDRSRETLRTGGPSGAVFARLAPGVTQEGAQAELTVLGLLPRAAVSEADELLEPRVVPYTFAFTGDFERGQIRWVVRVILLLVTVLLLPPCANIAILVYARTVTRQEEFAARYALGAGRGRIVAQLFIEVLVLATGAACVALVLARLALRRVNHLIDQGMSDGPPFWMDFDLSVTTVVFVAALAMLAALIAGAVPALKATGGQMQAGLQALAGRSGLQLGSTWTVLVVAQIAFSLAALPSAVEMGWGTLRTGILGPGFAAEEYLTADLSMDRELLATGTVPEDDHDLFAQRFAAVRTELVRQLEAEPEVSGVTVAAAVPGEEPWVTVEVEGIDVETAGIFRGNDLVQFNHVDDAFFDVFDFPILTGRGFDAGDLDPPRTVVIVNQTFVEQFMGEAGSSQAGLLGRRLRHLRGNAEASEPPVWYEIVGIVADRPAHLSHGTIYHPMAPETLSSASLALRVASTPASVADRLREAATALDPALRLQEILPLDEIYRENAMGNNLGAFSLGAVTLSVLLLSAAGIYALMSFTVNQRRREIGIRSALGAQPSRLLAGVFRRALAQLSAGALCGILMALLLGHYVPVEAMGGWNVPGVIPSATAFMVLVGALAATGPARRGLRVEPTEALREG